MRGADPGIQRVPLGGSHADRCGGMRRRSRLLDARGVPAGTRLLRPRSAPAASMTPAAYADRRRCRFRTRLGVLPRYRRHARRLRRHRRRGSRARSGVRAICSSELYRRAGGAVALISGRSIADIDRLFPMRRLPAAGQHGMERRDAAGRDLASSRCRRSVSTRRGAGWPRRPPRHPGLLLEDKGLSLALHYRRAPQLAGFAHRLMRVVQAAAGRRVRRAARQARRGAQAGRPGQGDRDARVHAGSALSRAAPRVPRRRCHRRSTASRW